MREPLIGEPVWYKRGEFSHREQFTVLSIIHSDPREVDLEAPDGEIIPNVKYGDTSPVQEIAA